MAWGRGRVSKADGQPLESAIQAGIVRSLQLFGCLVLEVFKGSARGGATWGTKGIPDLIVVHKGRVVFLEVKRPKSGVISPAQKTLHALLRAAGAEVHVVMSDAEALAVMGLGHAK